MRGLDIVGARRPGKAGRERSARANYSSVSVNVPVSLHVPALA